MGNEFYRPRIAEKLLSEKLDVMEAALGEYIIGKFYDFADN